MRGRIATAVMLCVFVVGAGTAIGQGLPVEPAFGVKAGVNISKFEVTGSSTAGRTGFVGGLYGKFPLGSGMTVVLDALYAQKGFTKSSYQNITDWDLKLDYLELPLTFNVDIPTAAVHPYVYAGMAAGVLLSANGKNSTTGGVEEDVKNQLKGTNWALVFGLGLRYERWTLDARFNHGLTDLAKEDFPTELKDRTFSFTAGYSFLR